MSEPSSQKRHRPRIPFILLVSAAPGLLVYPFEFPLPPWAGFLPWLFLLPVFAAFCLALVSAKARALAGRPYPWFLPFHLAFFFSAGWAVKALIDIWGLIPLVFFLAYPFSLLSRDPAVRKAARSRLDLLFGRLAFRRRRTGVKLTRTGDAGRGLEGPPDDLREVSFAGFWARPDVFWVPLLTLLLPSLSRLASFSRQDLLVWTAGFFLFGLVFSLAYGWRRYETRYARTKEILDNLEKDKKWLRNEIKGGKKLEDIPPGGPRGKAILMSLVTDQDRLYHDLLTLGLKTFNARTAILFLNEAPDGYRIRASVSPHFAGKVRFAMLEQDHPAIREAERRGGVLLGDPPAEAAGRFPFYQSGVPVRSLLLRLLSRDKGAGLEEPSFLGAIYFDHGDKGAFGPDNLEQLEHLAESILKISRIFAGMNWKATSLDRIDFLANFSRNLTQTLDPGQIAFSALQVIFQMATLQGVAVILLENEGLRVQAAEGVFHNLEGNLIPFGEPSLLQQAVKVGSPMEWQQRPGRGIPCFFRRGEQLAGFSAFLAHPSRMKERTMAILVVALGSRAAEDPKQFAAVKDSVRLVADHAAPALENAYSHKEIEALSRTDGLTGLENHRVFQEALQSKISRAGARGYGGPFALLLLDVDFFKQVNDNYGHPVGDDVLREVARRIRASVRELDLVARYGGEEFAAILDEVKTVGDALRIAEKVRTSVAASPVSTAAGPLRKTISVGYALFNPRERITSQELLDRADQALYRAKEAGRNRTVGFHEITGRLSSKAGPRNHSTH